MIGMVGILFVDSTNWIHQMEEFLFYHSYSKLEFISYALFAKLKPDYTVACYNFQSTKEKKKLLPT